MTPLSPELLDLAESLNAHLPLAASDERIAHPEWVVWLGSDPDHPAFTVVQRFRLRGDEVDPAVARIRALLSARGRRRSTWEIGPSATPTDLADRLLDHGLTPFEEPIAAGMVLRRPLQPFATDLSVRRAESVEDTMRAYALLHDVFGQRRESEAEQRARAERTVLKNQAGSGAIFVAELGGEMVSAANAIYLPSAVVLSGAATLEHARGRGAYRALVSARYEDAARRNTPTLVIQAGAMSRPILEKLGFETVAEVRIFEDASLLGDSA